MLDAPSVAITRDSDGVAHGWLAFLADSASGAPQVRYAIYDFATDSWGRSGNLSHAQPLQYVGFSRPNVVVRASPRSGAERVVWDATDSYDNDKKLIICRNVPLGESEILSRILKGQSQNDLQIEELDSMVLGVPDSGMSTRILSLTNAAENASLSIELGRIRVWRADETCKPIQLVELSEDSGSLGGIGILKAGRSKPFSVGTEAESLEVLVAAYGNSPASMFSGSEGSVEIRLLRGLGNTSGLTVFKLTFSELANRTRVLMRVTVPLRELTGQGLISTYSLEPVITELDTGVVLSSSIANIYSSVAGDLIGVHPTGINEKRVQPTVAKEFILGQNYPNPFNPVTAIRYELPQSSSVKLSIYDLLGREVSVLVNEQKAPGTYEVKFDGSRLASGVYFYQLTAGSFIKARPMLLVK
jgi:hypothetical protein